MLMIPREEEGNMVRCLARGVWSSSLFLLFRFHLFLFSLISASSSSTPLLFSFLFFSLLFFIFVCLFLCIGLLTSAIYWIRLNRIYVHLSQVFLSHCSDKWQERQVSFTLSQIFFYKPHGLGPDVVVYTFELHGSPKLIFPG